MKRKAYFGPLREIVIGVPDQTLKAEKSFIRPISLGSLGATGHPPDLQRTVLFP